MSRCSQAVAAMGQYQKLMRALALAIDIEVPLDGVAAASNVRVTPSLAAPPAPMTPWTAYKFDKTKKTFIVAPSAHVTVLANVDGKGIVSKPITVSQLAALVAGTSSLKLFEPLESGVWIRVRIDTIQELDQQYEP